MKSIIILFLLFTAAPLSSCFSQEVPGPDTITAEGKIFDRVEVEASYPGGAEAWLQYMMKNANAGVATDNGAPTGTYTVIIQFVVATDGKLSEFKPLTRLGYGMEQEVVRVLKLSGQWAPAMQNGRPIKAFRKQPVTFNVAADYFSVVSATPYFLYMETDNEVTVQADKVKADDLRLTISQGIVKPGANGKYIVRVNKPGRAVITLWNDKKNKEIGAASFEVIEKR